MLVDPNQIRNILTLRYDPSQKPLLPQLTWKDFVPKTSDFSLDFIEKSIENYILKKIHSSDVKRLSLALSGGVDSSLVLAFLKKTIPDLTIDAISIKFADSIDETKTAEKIAEHFGINHHVLFLENYLKELPKAISITKLPFWDLHWYYVAKKSKNFSNYLAAGDGGDEVFGGYTFRYAKFLSLINLKSSTLEKTKAYLKCHERDSVIDQEEIFGEKISFDWNLIYDQILPHFDNSLSDLDQVFLADYNGKLMYNFAPINQRINNYFELTSIAPLLSTKIIFYASHLHSKQKYDDLNNIGKIPLQQLLRKYNLDSLILKAKQGFSVDTLNLWKSYGQELCKYYLSDARIVKDQWINGNWILKHIGRNDLDVRYVNKFLGLLALEIWYRLFITQEMKSDTNLS
ncbi:asparagine synthase C-terminal domain-containing protein [Nitrosopumilus ureiphilus]|uniref:Asparagine synthase n=1 Tax=Nitrosopumilus ureiphilus TaxID=1470067 RepID=A0A7D5M6R2_9ARCH|nr:asparagine synthase C-terminal domain-containing protein [Nitrosopumilus ureiphilus]QLH07833.1 asparagine synthase [Nitrosopumilus ureiphilus]